MADDQIAKSVADQPPSVAMTCWRCGLSIATLVQVCPHCAARLESAQTMRGWGDEYLQSRNTSLKILFSTFGLLLFTGIVHAVMLSLIATPSDLIDLEIGAVDADVRTRILIQVLIVEAIDTLIIAIAWLLWPRNSYPQVTAPRGRIAAWTAALPILAGLIGLNLGYHWIIRQFLGVPLVTDELMSSIDALSFVAVCLQPAIVEEWYCRRLALDSLQAVMGRHAAVWISATMFGLLHVAVLPSIPYLIVVGAAFGYLRLASGKLLLPMALHLVHNFIIMLLE
jgi:membrane protease YdiL (CAAX protease family)